MVIKLLKYKPYSNRENIGYDVVSSYEPYVVQTFNSINFIPGDGVNTSVILNTSEVNSSADYLLAIKDDGTTIDSRWFIMDAARTRQGQYKFSLYRDTLYDFKTEIADSVGYIKRGWITDTENPLLLNQEDFQTNQIVHPTSVEKLTSLYGSGDNVQAGPWIVGYLAKDAPGGTVSTSSGVNDVDRTLTPGEFAAFGGDPNNLDETLSAYYIASIRSAPSTYDSIELEVTSSYTSGGYITSIGDIVSGRGSQGRSSTQGTWNYVNPLQDAPALGEYIATNLNSGIKSELAAMCYRKAASELTDVVSSAFTEYDYVAYHGKRYRVSNSAIVYSRSLSPFTEDQVPMSSRRDIARVMNESNLLANTASYLSLGLTVNASVKLKVITLTPVDGTNILTIPEEFNRCAAGKIPYDIFAIKADNDGIGFRIAQAISEKYKGSGALYDLQLVPYVDLYQSKTSPITQSSNPCYWLNVNRNQDGHGVLTWNGNPWFNTTQTPVNIKIMNQCQKVRIISPNHSNIREFNPAYLGKHTEAIKYNFTLKWTLKPYSPIFAIGLPVGGTSVLLTSAEDVGNWLIISCDFSLPQPTDAWQTYQITNKNYLNAFNRQIESIELNNKYAKRNDVAGAVSGALSAAVSGGITGAAVGGPVGAAVGAVAGGLTSGIAGAIDVGTNEKLRADQLDLKKDMFDFDLQNIQALPTTIANVGAYDTMNYLFPYVIKYDTTAEEEAAFRQYLKYNGMKIGVISTLSNYKVSHRFIAADIIHIDLHEDTHLINTIREEVSKGFYDGRITNI